MAIDFPNSPSTNDQYTVGTTTWTYNGTAWVVSLGDASIATGAITADKIASNAVTTAKILDANITAAKIASDAVTTAKILDANVTAGKIASGAAVSNIGYTPANIASPTFTGTVVLPSTTSIGAVTSTEIGYVDGVTSAIQTQLDSKLTTTTAVTSNRNAIINGAMNVWQRGTSSGTLGVGGGSYVGPDRWWFYNNGFTTTMSRQLCGSTLPQFQYCARIQRTAGQTSTVASVFFSPLETANSVRFAGKNATLSFYARASSGASRTTLMDMSFFSGTGTDQSNFGGGAYTGSTMVGYLNPTLTTSWQRFSITGAVASTATELGVQIGFIPTGTAGASDWFEVTGIQLEEGSVATPFEFEDYSTTLAKCQRYYFRTTSATSPYAFHAIGQVAGTMAECALIPPVPMRVEPTSVSSSNLSIQYASAAVYAVTAVTLDSNVSTPNAAGLLLTIGTSLSANSCRILSNNSTSGYIDITAEL